MSHVLDEVVEGLEPSAELLSVMARSNTPVLLGLDIGTSGVRAALFDERGREIAGASVRVARSWPDATEIETFDADRLLEQVAETLDALFAKLYGWPTRIELMAVSCFWHSLVGVDENWRATTPVMGWADPRAAAAAYQLRSEFDEAKTHARTGCRFHQSYWPAKLRRLRNEEPETFRGTTRWLSFAEYLSLHFFGETAVSVSMASGTGLLNQRTCEWDEELLAALEVSVESLPEIAAPNKTFHGLRSAYAARWPQLCDARAFPGVGDGAANNIGAGCHSIEKLGLMIGTSGALRVCFKGEAPEQLPTELWCYRVDRDRILIGGALSDGGGLYAWLRDSLLREENFETIESELELLSPDTHGLTVLPFWSGERSTGWHPNARGAILGLTLQTRPIEILRAATEAVAYRFALIGRALEPFAPGGRLIASGHALRCSPTWAQILADVLGRRLALSETSEASTRGAALLALEAAGRIGSIEEFTVAVETVFEPNKSHYEIYQNGLKRQQRLYEKLIT
jgi:gluconokinase